MNLPTDQTDLALLNTDGHLNELIKFYPSEFISKLMINKEKLNRVAAVFSDLSKNITSSTLAMKCSTSSCPFKDSCFLKQNDFAPEGKQCPIEQKIIADMEVSLVMELDIDRQNTIEMELLYDLIDAKLLDMRTSGLLMDGAVTQTITSTGHGMISTFKDIAPEFKVKMELKKLKSDIYEDFIATRRAKKKFGLDTGKKGISEVIKQAIKEKDEQR